MNSSIIPAYLLRCHVSSQEVHYAQCTTPSECVWHSAAALLTVVAGAASVVVAAGASEVEDAASADDVEEATAGSLAEVAVDAGTVPGHPCPGTAIS